MSMDLALAFGLGLLAGSFVNVLIHRLPRMINSEIENYQHLEHYNLSWPASHCPHCLTPLKIWQNIPVVSFLLLKGQCHQCRTPINRMYPTVEIFTACTWLMCAIYWGADVTGLSWAIFATILMALSIIDWQTTLLPDILTQALIWIGLGASSLGFIQLASDQSIWGAIAGYSSLWFVATVFEKCTGKQGMGAGDFKLLAGLGAWLGPLALIPLVLMASLSGAFIGLWLKFTNRLNQDGYIPFGPFLAAAGMFIAAIGMKPIASWFGWSFIA